jgi:hypothetical protein
MKEALMVIASAWSTTFIILFFAFTTVGTTIAPSDVDARAHVIFALFVGAVTGAGWLWFRREAKKSRRVA